MQTTPRTEARRAHPVPRRASSELMPGGGFVLATSRPKAGSSWTREREIFIDNLLVRVHLIIEMSRPALRHGSLNSLFQVALYLPSWTRSSHHMTGGCAFTLPRGLLSCCGHSSFPCGTASGHEGPSWVLPTPHCSTLSVIHFIWQSIFINQVQKANLPTKPAT